MALCSPAGGGGTPTVLRQLLYSDKRRILALACYVGDMRHENVASCWIRSTRQRRATTHAQSVTHQQQSRTRFIAVSLRLNGRPRSDRASRRSTGCARKKVSPAPRKVKRVRYLHGVGRRQANEGRRNKAQGTALSWPYDADYEREFMLADRRCCYPLTVSDFASRYLIACQALSLQLTVAVSCLRA
jgi:hypothetical protein